MALSASWPLNATACPGAEPAPQPRASSGSTYCAPRPQRIRSRAHGVRPYTAAPMSPGSLARGPRPRWPPRGPGSVAERPSRSPCAGAGRPGAPKAASSEQDGGGGSPLGAVREWVQGVLRAAAPSPQGLRPESATPLLPSSFTFPEVPPAAEALLTELLGQVHAVIEQRVLPSKTPADVRSFRTEQGSRGSVSLFRGKDPDEIDRVVLSWLFCPLPGGAALGFATIVVLLGPASDAPHLQVELIFQGRSGQGGEGPMEFDQVTTVMDLLPRRDVVRFPEYLKRVYEDTGLDAARKEAKANPSLITYEAPTPFVRAVLSPTALSITVSRSETLPSEESIVGSMKDIACKVVSTWAEMYHTTRGNVLSDQIEDLRARDRCIFEYGIEADLTRNLPRVFGEEIAHKVTQAVTKS